MAQLKGFVSAVSTRNPEYVDKKTGEKKTLEVRSFNVEGVWLQLPNKSLALPEKGRQVTLAFHTETTTKEEKGGKKKYFANHICDGYQYVA
ncbi:MAG TPA: hypothetical protein VFD70_24500 [Anaerolineae bacterium]|nr:hypothetical protein [Anaerolineae bacterium]